MVLRHIHLTALAVVAGGGRVAALPGSRGATRAPRGPGLRAPPGPAPRPPTRTRPPDERVQDIVPLAPGLPPVPGQAALVLDVELPLDRELDLGLPSQAELPAQVQAALQPGTMDRQAWRQQHDSLAPPPASPGSAEALTQRRHWLLGGAELTPKQRVERQQYLGLLELAATRAAEHDVASPMLRTPGFRKSNKLVALPLTARAAAMATLANSPRLEAAPPLRSVESSVVPVSITPALQHTVAQVLDDPRWRERQEKQSGYAAYLAQLQRKLTDAAAEPDEYDRQLVYQVGISDDWLQLSVMLDVFGEHVGPLALGAAAKHLAGLAPPKTRAAFSPSEAQHFAAFTARIAARAALLAGRMGGTQVSQVLYGCAAVASGADTALVELLLSRTQEGKLLRSCTPADMSSMLWALGTLGHKPSIEWMEEACRASLASLPMYHANQLWGALWGCARVGHMPPEDWLAAWLAAAEKLLSTFNAEGLSNIAWALGALGCVPDRAWLRCFAATLVSKVRSLMPGHLTLVVEGLSRISYRPRDDVCAALLGQVRRHFHVFTPDQLCILLYSIAQYGTWVPYRQFLYDYVSHSRHKIASFSVANAAAVLWAFARFRYMPDESYTNRLVRQLQQRLPFAAAADLSMSLWALASFRLAPSDHFMSTWHAAAAQRLPSFTAPDVAYSVWALAAIQQPPPEERLVGMLRQAAVTLPTFSGMELSTLLGALAALRYRPSDAWLDAAAAQARDMLPAMTNEDFGLIIHALACFGHELDRDWLVDFSREAHRKLYSMSGEGLGMLVWGLGQYRFVPSPAERWWTDLYAESDIKWDSSTPAGLSLLLLGLAELLATAPPADWQRRAVKAVRLKFPKPDSGADVPRALLAAAGPLVAGEGDELPDSLWLKAFVAELQMRWGFAYSLDDAAQRSKAADRAAGEARLAARQQRKEGETREAQRKSGAEDGLADELEGEYNEEEWMGEDGRREGQRGTLGNDNRG